MDSFASSSGSSTEACAMMNCLTNTTAEPEIGELHQEEHWPLSGKPYFHVILTESYLKIRYQLVLPARILPAIPSGVHDTSISYCGKEWNMLCNAGTELKRLHSGWSKFLSDNKLNVGDACVFELMECSDNKLKFRVQILKNRIPYQIQLKMNGDSRDSPVVLEQA